MWHAPPMPEMLLYGIRTMTLDGFLTFLALVVAVYSIAPTARRLRLGLHRFWPTVISLIGFCLVVYYEVFALKWGFPCPTALGRVCQYITYSREAEQVPGQIAFGVVVVWLALILFIFNRKQLSIRAFPALARLVEQLAYERRHAELLELVEPHLKYLDRAARRKFFSAMLYDWLVAFDPRRRSFADRILDLSVLRNAPSRKTRAFRFAKILFSNVSIIIPAGNRYENAARETLRVLLLSPELTEFVARFRPEFGVKLLDCSVSQVHEFCDTFLRSLISNKGSRLYVEAEQNANFSSGHCYEFPEHNKLLYFLFNDARNAENLEVWRPLGEYVIDSLRPIEGGDYIRVLADDGGNFERRKWQDPTFVVLHIFDLMVSAAEYQGIQWHMWLYYFRHFLESLIAVYDNSGLGVDPDAEWPTGSSYLIYRIFDSMGDWIKLVQDLPEGSPHLTPTNNDLHLENGNIPKSAILALGQCFSILLDAQQISPRFKGYIHDIVMNTIRNLSRDGVSGGPYRTVLIQSVIHGGMWGSRMPPTHGTRLRELWLRADHVMRAAMDDYESALNAAYPPNLVGHR